MAQITAPPVSNTEKRTGGGPHGGREGAGSPLVRSPQGLHKGGQPSPSRGGDVGSALLSLPGPNHPSPTQRTGWQRLVLGAGADVEGLGAGTQLVAVAVHPQHPTLGETDTASAASTACFARDLGHGAHGLERYLWPVTPERSRGYPKKIWVAAGAEPLL